MIYLDTSALAKMVVEEAESEALDAWLAARPGKWFTSALAEVELAHALRRDGQPAALAGELLRGVARLEIGAQIRARAATIGASGLRTLDAIHVASALELHHLVPGTVTVVTYDARMVIAAGANGLAVASPA